MPTAMEKPKAQNAEKFKSPEEELAYLRQRVAEKEREIGAAENRFENDRIARREIQQYANVPAARVLHEAYVLPEHETLRQVLKLDPEAHDKQIDGLLDIVREHGIRNALAVVARMKNPHLEDDLHRVLVRYVAEGLPEKGMAPPEKIRRALNMVLFEVQPQAHGSELSNGHKQKLEQLLASSEQLYAGLLSLVGERGNFSLEIAVPQGTEEAGLYLAVPRERKALAERLISSVFPNARISENRGDYNIFNYEGEHAAAYATLAEHSVMPLKTYEAFEHDPLNILLAAFAKIGKHDEGAALQILVGSEGDRYNRHYQKMLRELERGKTYHEALRVPETAFGDFLHEITDVVTKTEKQKEYEREREFKKAGDSLTAEAVGRKIKSRIAPCVIRIVTSAPTHARAKELLGNIGSSLGQFDDAKGNRFVIKPVSHWNLIKFLREYSFREFDTSLAIPLSLSEITSLFHFTAENVTTSRELKKTYAKQSPAPVDMPSEGIVIGVNRYGATETSVRFGTADRLRHSYVIGQTGTGKTGLIKNMIIQDIKNGDGLAFIDPHGSDIEDILASIPPERVQDVIYFD
ncbi:MAG TPA: hypothetical protein VMU27_00245, partial [Candidatus Paceibacterota bacterium]|nr:hypothetical protein [Candidatus Paceibacterota bacterium]